MPWSTQHVAASAAIVVGSVLAVQALRRALTARDRTASALRRLIGRGKKAVCVGKNYREHITELAQLGPEWKLEEEPEPVLFLKPTTSYAWPGEPLVLPRPRPMCGTGSPEVRTVHGVHHELELGVIVGRRAKGVTDDAAAMACVAGYVLALDITERDEQTAAKVKGMPWTVSKGYDSFLPLSEPFTLEADEDWRGLKLWLRVNGERRQTCEAGTMIHSGGRAGNCALLPPQAHSVTHSLRVRAHSARARRLRVVGHDTRARRPPRHGHTRWRRPARCG
jgi:2-keto-4-pentenoate hydratase/2-oxohepta-3-ene-1,7-dioic acid hydratase in catechol pathway